MSSSCIFYTYTVSNIPPVSSLKDLLGESGVPHLKFLIDEEYCIKVESVDYRNTTKDNTAPLAKAGSFEALTFGRDSMVTGKDGKEEQKFISTNIPIRLLSAVRCCMEYIRDKLN